MTVYIYFLFLCSIGRFDVTARLVCHGKLVVWHLFTRNVLFVISDDIQLHN